MGDFSPVWQPLYILHQQLVLHAQKAGLITVSLACQDFTGRTSPYISWNKPRAQHGDKIYGKFGFLWILQDAQQLVGREGGVDGREGIKYSAFGEPLETAYKQILCSAELTGKWLSQPLSQLISGTVSFQHLQSAAQSAHQAVPYHSHNPSPPHSGRADKWEAGVLHPAC